MNAKWQVVPIEPTEAMLAAGANGSGEDSEMVAAGAYAAMIAAAPAPADDDAGLVEKMAREIFHIIYGFAADWENSPYKPIFRAGAPAVLALARPAIEAQVRRDVVEECARVAETFAPAGQDYPARGHEIATAIRSLAPSSEPAEQPR